MMYIAAKGPLWKRLLTVAIATLASSALFAIVAIVPNQSIYNGALGEALAVGLAIVGVACGWYGIRLKRSLSKEAAPRSRPGRD